LQRKMRAPWSASGADGAGGAGLSGLGAPYRAVSRYLFPLSKAMNRTRMHLLFALAPSTTFDWTTAMACSELLPSLFARATLRAHARGTTSDMHAARRRTNINHHPPSCSQQCRVRLHTKLAHHFTSHDRMSSPPPVALQRDPAAQGSIVQATREFRERSPRCVPTTKASHRIVPALERPESGRT